MLHNTLSNAQIRVFFFAVKLYMASMVGFIVSINSLQGVPLVERTLVVDWPRIKEAPHVNAKFWRPPLNFADTNYHLSGLGHPHCSR